MTKEKIISFSLFLITVSFLSYFSPPLTVADEKFYSNWAYSIQNDIENSKRSYLLVYRPQTPQERRINVISQCRKPYPAEGVYGTCTHDLDIQPTNAKFILKTGEDVVMIQASWDAALIIGTIEYGCCAGPDTVRFYAESGKYLGSMDGNKLSSRFNYGNMITRTLDVGNSTRYDKTIYFAVRVDDKDTGFHALVLDGRDRVDHRVRSIMLLYIPFAHELT